MSQNNTLAISNKQNIITKDTELTKVAATMTDLQLKIRDREVEGESDNTSKRGN